MTDKRYAISSLKLGLLASVISGIFWGVWYFSGHQIPLSGNLGITKNISANFYQSRAWDILFAFITLNVYAWIARFYYKIGCIFNEKNDFIGLFTDGIFLGMVSGFIFGLGMETSVYIYNGFIAEFIIGCIASVGLIIFTEIKIARKDHVALVTGLTLASGLGFGTGVGLFHGLNIGLITGISMSLGTCIGLITGFVLGIFIANLLLATK